MTDKGHLGQNVSLIVPRCYVFAQQLQFIQHRSMSLYCTSYAASCGFVAEENSRDVPQGGADEEGEEEVEVDVETAEVEGG